MIFVFLLISCVASLRLSTRAFKELIEEENIRDDMFNYDQFVAACTDTLYFAGYVRHGDLMIGDFCEAFFVLDKGLAASGPNSDKVSLKQVEKWVKSKELETHWEQWRRNIFKQFMQWKDLHIPIEEFVLNFRELGFSYPKLKASQADQDEILWDIEDHDEDWEDFEDFWLDDAFEQSEFSIEEELVRFKHEDT